MNATSFQLTLTDEALQRVQSALDERGEGVGVRLGVRPAGCSGLEYFLEWVDAPKDDDVCVTQGDVTVFVDEGSRKYLDSVEVSWETEGLNSGFTFHNPNAKGSCGCGTSFYV